ncbi:cupin domain-containing protein [Pedobacter sp. SYP-B3415]|uniref:cupin domain-containing protein n=1 Tax=Pedobacter sp. SYP-B3415 TaxID=2496641 RepID=UPI001F0D68DB|nr:cupin domain-containing protein [Pedobacter sp. SYP-B3415]
MHHIIGDLAGDYENRILSTINDHVLRISLMTKDYFWHLHPNSDETFMVLEGKLWIDLENESAELCPGDIFTVPAGVLHRTRPGGKRSVNLTFERADIITVNREPGG